MFDFNRDGREDFGEQWLAFKIFEECTKQNDTEIERCQFILNSDTIAAKYLTADIILRRYKEVFMELAK